MISRKMAPSPNDDKRHGFLLNQSFWLAESKSQDMAWSMAVHEVEPSEDQTKLESDIRPPLDGEYDWRKADGRWLRIDRDELVRRAIEELSWSRVGLVCGAGLGKTTSLQWL